MTYLGKYDRSRKAVDLKLINEWVFLIYTVKYQHYDFFFLENKSILSYIMLLLLVLYLWIELLVWLMLA